MEENQIETSPSKQEMSYTRYVIIILLILVVAIGAMYFLKKNSQQTAIQPKPMITETATPTANTAMKSITPTTTGSAAKNMTVQKFTVTASNFTFTPKTLTVKKGQPVEITFTNAGGAHDFVINEFTVKTQILASGKSETVTFTPDKTGTFDYYCSVGNHRAMGMQGTITVE